jgi:hypothetical protein
MDPAGVSRHLSKKVISKAPVVFYPSPSGHGDRGFFVTVDKLRNCRVVSLKRTCGFSVYPIGVPLQC